MNIAVCLVAAGLTAAPAPEKPIEGQVTTHDGIKLSYRKYGSGAQAIVVPLGFIMEPDFKCLGAPGRTLVFYDQRNRGRSDVAPPERSTLADEVRDMETLRAHLRLAKVPSRGNAAHCAEDETPHRPSRRSSPIGVTFGPAVTAGRSTLR